MILFSPIPLELDYSSRKPMPFPVLTPLRNSFLSTRRCLPHFVLKKPFAHLPSKPFPLKIETVFSETSSRCDTLRITFIRTVSLTAE